LGGEVLKVHKHHIWNGLENFHESVFAWLRKTVKSVQAVPFAPGASISVAMCRIAICYSMMQSLLYLDAEFVARFSATASKSIWLWDADIRPVYYYETWLTRVSPSDWVPKGLVKLFFNEAPPTPPTMYAIVVFAYISVLSAMVGFCTRLAMPAAVLSVLLISSIFTSWGPYWSHGFNVVHLAGLAFMFGRSGDRLSVDALIARMLGRSKVAERDTAGVYRWPVVFGELAVHMFLFAAFWSKYNNGAGIWWALSDNLRNSLAVTWGTYRSHPPIIIDFVMAHLVAFRFVGLAQLFLQSTTIISCTLIRYPVYRGIIGGLFMALEIVGLHVLFEFHQWNWVPLIAFSIDWDRLWAWLNRKAGSASLAPAISLYPQTTRSLPNRTAKFALLTYMVLFFGYYIANFVFQLGERHLNYPFSSMAFFSRNRSLPPYLQSADWTEARGRILITQRGDAAPLEIEQIPSAYGEMWRARTGQQRVDAVQAIVNASNTGQGWCISEKEMKRLGRWKPEYEHLRGDAYLRACGYAVPKGSLNRLELWFSASVVPARPALPLPMLDTHLGLIGVYADDQVHALGANSSYDPVTQQHFLEIEARNLDIVEKRVFARFNVDRNRDWRTMPEPVELVGEWHGNQFFLDSSKKTGQTAWPLIKIMDRKLGELIFYAPDFSF
jgi:hypothetical protein